ncbi:VirD4-like conjugal transfer protein, CD1115 family [Intestinimonas butyriciproducens]|uniref:VirD4-like conjugal transfer protein, CD1115 family n=1 Tax=Intestinimonas butyriciproducens TaxID=1297617 RepID=UPI0019575F87|nr:type IV secretory system conjugative DNA transfer family protein [Intestinimonas butyriciproducens]
MKQSSRAGDIVLALFFYVPVVWGALLIAQSFGHGLPELLANLTAALQHPLDIHWTDKSLLSILICTGLYIMGLCIYASEQGRTRDGEEHGSAAWGSPRQVNAMFRQKENKILTRHVRLGLDTHKHRRSLNVLVIGGSGAAKTRSYVKPNILEANTNYVITDPKMEVLTATGGWLKSKGYEIRVLNLVNLEESDGYNPFRYLRDEKDVLKLVNNLIQATTPKGSHESDPFWTKAETALLQAIILMLFQEAPEYEQNFSMVMRVLEYAEVREEDDEYLSPLDLLFQAMERENPESVALRQYKVFKQSAGKTAKSILVSAAVRLAPFNLPQIRAITDHDDMDLYTLGEKKCALYAVIPDNDNTFNFLVSLLYSQAFQTLYYSADQIHHGALPQHVHFVLDEFAAMPLPGYTRELATMRSRNISSSTIIQNMAQIKELYKDSWETIPGNSDTILYLGGNEQSTHKYISEALGKATIDTKTHGQTKGKSGSYSTNFQMSGRELLTPDEVRALDNRYCILFIRGAKPVMDLKYELTEHPAIRYTVDGGGAPYIHHGHNTTPAIPGTPFFQVISADETNKEKETAA